MSEPAAPLALSSKITASLGARNFVDDSSRRVHTAVQTPNCSTCARRPGSTMRRALFRRQLPLPLQQPSQRLSRVDDVGSCCCFAPSDLQSCRVLGTLRIQLVPQIQTRRDGNGNVSNGIAIAPTRSGQDGSGSRWSRSSDTEVTALLSRRRMNELGTGCERFVFPSSGACSRERYEHLGDSGKQAHFAKTSQTE